MTIQQLPARRRAKAPARTGVVLARRPMGTQE